MKKQLLALAALAAVSGVAVAQNATVYGFLDVGVSQTNNGNAAGQSRTTAAQAGGNWFPSMYGITGTEDLGGGLKATFNLQGSLNAMTGNNADASANNIFGRYASLKLSGNGGSLEMGRQIDLLFLQSFVNGVIPTHSNSLAVNGLLTYGGGDRATTAAGSASNTNANVDGSRIDNAFTYRTPTFNGVNAAVMYAPGGVAGSTSANSVWSALVTASVSGLNLSAGYASHNASTAAGGTNYFHKSMVGAKYTFGQVDVAGQFHNYKANDGTIDTNATEFGVAYHLTSAATIGANLESFKDNASNKSPQILSFKGKYDLSKRTYLYGMYANYNADAATSVLQGYAINGLTTYGANKIAQNISVGVVHGF